MEGPAGATLRVDGKKRGKLPMRSALFLPAGDHGIEVLMDGFEPHSKQVIIQKGQQTRIAVTLKKAAPPAPVPEPTPAQATIMLKMDLDGATVEVDKKKVTAPADGKLNVEPGQHDLKISREGFVTIEQTVAVSANSSVEITSAWEKVCADDGLGPYITMALGGGLIVLGAVFSSDSDDDGAFEGRNEPIGSSNVEDDKKIAAAVLYSLGGVLVATGITLLVLDLTEDSGKESAEAKAGLLHLPGGLALTPTIGPEGGGLSAVLRF